MKQYGGTINDQTWPEYEEAKCVDDQVEIVVQINGKVRSKLVIPVDAAQDDVLAAAKDDEKIVAQLAGKTIVKELYVKGKLVNIVVR